MTDPASSDGARRPTSTLSAAPDVLDLPGIEQAVLAHWRDAGTEAASLHDAGDRPTFVFYDGPPFATGLPHYGHLLAGTIKDIVPRFWAMRGYHVERRFGWDCHGLPIESLVEKELGVHGRGEIEALGVPKFNAACRAGVLRFTKEWEQVVKRMGRWVDFDNDYKTMDRSFMESVWWVFRQLWDKGLIYEGYRVQPVSPALGTPLSNFEVAQGPQERDPVSRKEGHRRRQDPSVTVRFALEDEPGASLWAWTTTPWTLPTNLALAVHPEVIYVKVRVTETGEVAYLEPGRLADYQARGRIGDTEELARVTGADLVGRPYAPLFPYFEQFKTREDGSRWAFRVVSAEYVTTDSGTGIVHQAPAHGEDDYQIGQREGLPLAMALDLNGVFSDAVPDFAGQFAKDADKDIIASLKASGKLVDHDTLVHAYPHCYRTEQPLLYMAISTWFMKVEQMRDALVGHNEKIHWVPDHVGEGRFGNWLASASDWNLSRNRYWGTPLPVWRCDEDPSDMVCVGSVAELETLAGLEAGSLTDLHREHVDEITFPSSKTPGGTMRRVTEVFDCWFESGSMPYAQNHYPFDAAKKAYVEENTPANFIAEGLDQTRGWFYTLHVLSTALFDRPAFENVIVNGLILAADGKKMSKRLKNYPDPQGVIDTYGADALRAYLINSPVVRAEPMRFGKHAEDTSGEAVKDTVRTVILPLWNAYNFLTTYARADGWSPISTAAPEATSELDRWILSRLQSFLAKIVEEYEAYSLYNLVPRYLELCEDLNNWYIRRGRRRYWRSGDDSAASDDKHAAYQTLYHVLVTVSHAMAPVIPFFCEWMFQRLVVDVELGGDGPTSVHLRDFPTAELSRRDEALERRVALARRAVGLGLSLREQQKRGVRRPLAAMTVASPDADVRAAIEAHAGDLRAELNVREVKVAADDGGLVTVSAKANFKVLGRRLGKKMKTVAAGVAALDEAAVQTLLDGGSVEVEGETLAGDDVLVTRTPREGQVVESDSDFTVVLDMNVPEALELEGLAREVVNRVQNLRKAAGLHVSDRITLRVHGEGALARALADETCRALIAAEVLADAVDVTTGEAAATAPAHRTDDVDGDALVLGVARVDADASGGEG